MCCLLQKEHTGDLQFGALYVLESYVDINTMTHETTIQGRCL
jgi:hypothetical protein